MPALSTFLVSLASLWTADALAHEGHGLVGSHWHATDSFGWVGLAVAAAVAWWFTRGGR